MKKQTMMTVVAMALSMVTLAACQKNDGSTPVGRDQSNISAQWAAGNGITLNGNITSGDGDDVFREDVIGFVEPRCSPSAGCDSKTWVGFISSQAQGTGVFLGGKVEMQSGVLNPNLGTQMAIRADSKLFVAVYDEFAGLMGADGKVISYIPRSFQTASGYVQGNQAQITFTDTSTINGQSGVVGTVKMQGTFSGQQFYGDFSYTNMRRGDGTAVVQPVSVSLGSFNVPTCQFFRCQ